MASSTSRQSRAASKSSTPTANREAVEYIAKLPALLAKDGLTAKCRGIGLGGAYFRFDVLFGLRGPLHFCASYCRAGWLL
jgi:hypothetical protein